MMRSENIWSEYLDLKNITFEYPEGSIYNYLEQNAKKNLDETAVEFEGKKTSYRKLLRQIEETAKALVNMGIKKSDVVSIISINTPEVLVMIYAANRIGAVVNMIHPLSSTAEMTNFIETTNSSAVLVLEQLYPKIANKDFNCRTKPKIIITRITYSLPLYIKPLFALKNKNKVVINPKHTVIYWNKFISSASKANIVLPEDEGTKDDTAVIMYSGGTTGTPKGVMLTNININSYSIQAFEVSGIREPKGKKFLAILPLFHGFGFASGIHANLCKGVHIFLLPKFELKKSVEKIFKNKINFIYAIPALFEAIVRSEYIEKQDLSFFECLICGGDKLQPKLNEKLQNYLKKGNSRAVFCEGYGQTECVAACLTNPYFAPVQKSVGILLPDMSAKIVELGTQTEVPNGVDGELCINGPTVMKGYYENAEETQKVLQTHADGKTWLHTGDIFSRDDNGYFYFKQRISRMAISSGYNIYVTLL
jgi:long-chain acyl-CoA synthetase